MQPVSYARHRYPANVIRQKVWLYFRFTLSLRDVEDLMAERGLDNPQLDTEIRPAVCGEVAEVPWRSVTEMASR